MIMFFVSPTLLGVTVSGLVPLGAFQIFYQSKMRRV